MDSSTGAEIKRPAQKVAKRCGKKEMAGGGREGRRQSLRIGFFSVKVGFGREVAVVLLLYFFQLLAENIEPIATSEGPKNSI